MAFGAKLKELRTVRSWSQDELGRRIGVHGRHVAKYENARAMPNADTLVRIARTLDVTTDYLLLDELSDESSEGHLDQELLVYFRAVTALDERDRNIVIALIDAFVRSRRHPPENDTTIG